MQFLFGVGLVTMFAALMVFGFGWLWFSATGEWYFENTHIPVAVFLGIAYENNQCHDASGVAAIPET